MPDKENVLRGWDRCSKCLYPSVFDQQFKDCEYTMGMYCRKDKLISETVELLKEQDELLRKLQKDKDKLCLDVSEWKHKYHDRPLKEQEAVEPIPYHRSDGTIFKYECRQCRTKIFKMDLFCRHCGRSVKWE